MEPVEYISLSDTEVYINTLTRYIRVRNSYKARQRHYQLDTERGNVVMAQSRVEKLNENATEVQRLTPQVKQIVEQVNANLAADPKNKRARLLRLYADIITANVYDVAKIQQKISTLRSQVFKAGKTSTNQTSLPTDPTSPQDTPSEASLFD